MLVRYVKNRDGESEALAKIYTRDDHAIPLSKVDNDAKKIITRLEKNGYEAYLVGGAVRDILTGRTPKDFDIVTDARPAAIRQLFSRSRIIGRRFRLVHVYAGQKIIEVSTFRSADLDINNSYGTMRDDVLRRDFTMNALYYSPTKENIIDYVDGYQHIRAARIESVQPLERLFTTDPVRIIRAVRYSAITGFTIPRKMNKRIVADGELLENISSSRLTEEVLKILKSGASEQVFIQLIKLGLLKHLLPNLVFEGNEKQSGVSVPHGDSDRFLQNMKNLDTEIEQNRDIRAGLMLNAMTREFMTLDNEAAAEPEYFKVCCKLVKNLIKPLTPPNKEVEWAVRMFFREWGVPAPKRKPSQKRGGPAAKGVSVTKKERRKRQ